MAILTVKASGGTYTLSQFQTAIDAAQDGDTITIEAGATVTGSFILRNKGVLVAGITITSDAAAANLPAAGVRTNPSYAAFLPKIKSNGGGSPAMSTAIGANGYTLRHLEFLWVPYGYETILYLGTNDTTQTFVAQQPYNLTVDRCYFLGSTVAGQKHGINLNAGTCTISNNYFDNIFSYGADSQSILGVNGTGPYTITNNRLRAGTEVFIIGGSDPAIRTFMSITASTTTSASVTCSETGHTLSELSVGQGVGLQMVGATGGWVWSTIRSITGTGTSGSITFDAIATAPTIGTNTAKCGVILNGLTFRYNHCSNDPTWYGRGALDTPTGLSSATGSGSLAAGTYYYSVQASATAEVYENDLTNGFSIRTSETSKTLGAPGKITVSWTAVANADRYYVYRGTTAGAPTVYKIVTGATTLADDGSFGWTTGSPNPTSNKQIKNLFELKAVQNAQIDSNIFEYGWQGVDIGFAIWLKTVNQDGAAPYLQSKNITFEKNIIRHVYGFLEVHGRERKNSSAAYPGTLDGLIIRNNLVYDSRQVWSNNGTDSNYAGAISAVNNCTIDHNTIVHLTDGTSGGLFSVDSSDQLNTNLIITNNELRKETYGIHDPLGEGTAALAAACVSYTFTNNDIADATAGTYGAANRYNADTAWRANFIAFTVDGVAADYHIITSGADHLAGTDGKDLGADIDLVLTATAAVLSGIPGTPSPNPPVTPSAPNPANGATNVATGPTLTWSGTDATSWNVYFGTAPSPPLVSSGLIDASYTPALLANNTTYYWKIVAINAAGSTTGPIWSFTTIPASAGPAHKFLGRFGR